MLHNKVAFENKTKKLEKIVILLFDTENLLSVCLGSSYYLWRKLTLYQ